MPVAEARGIPSDSINRREKTEWDIEFERNYDPDGEKAAARIEKSVARVERDTLLLAKKKLKQQDDDDD